MPKQLRTDRPVACRLGTPDRMPPDSSSAGLKRRGFLLALGAGGASAAVVAARALSGDAARPLNATAVAEVAASGGYVATEHIRKYYRTTKT
jgi:hypothetical protein